MTTLLSLLIFAAGASPTDYVSPPAAPANSPGDGPGVVVLGPNARTVEPPSSVLSVPPGRFFAFSPADGAPSYLAPSDAYRVYAIKPGGQYTGVRFDAPDGADPESYEWPDAKGPVYVFLARSKPGDYSIQLVKNGPEAVGPVANGKPVNVRIGQGAQPPPPPQPNPDPNPKPSPTGETAWVVVLEETSQRTLSLTGLMDEMRTKIPAQGHKYRSYDKDQGDLPKGYLKSADSLPELIIVNLKGVELYRATITKGTTFADISKIVTKYTGK